MLFPKVKEKAGFDSTGLSDTSESVFVSLDVSTEAVGAKRAGLDCSAGGLDGFSASF